jgi:hypothetical protein
MISMALFIDPIIDDLGDGPTLGGPWACIADTVMGGCSAGTLHTETVAGRRARHLRGTVSLANNGGFVQMALDLVAGGGLLDASAFSGITLTICGDGGDYSVHLRTADVSRPWQSYRAGFTATTTWTTISLPFDDFCPHRLEPPLDRSRLRRLGLVALGRAGAVDLALADLRFY